MSSLLGEGDGELGSEEWGKPGKPLLGDRGREQEAEELNTPRKPQLINGEGGRRWGTKGWEDTNLAVGTEEVQ